MGSRVYNLRWWILHTLSTHSRIPWRACGRHCSLCLISSSVLSSELLAVLMLLMWGLHSTSDLCQCPSPLLPPGTPEALLLSQLTFSTECREQHLPLKSTPEARKRLTCKVQCEWVEHCDNLVSTPGTCLKGTRERSILCLSPNEPFHAGHCSSLFWTEKPSRWEEEL